MLKIPDGSSSPERSSSFLTRPLMGNRIRQRSYVQPELEEIDRDRFRQRSEWNPISTFDPPKNDVHYMRKVRGSSVVYE